MVEQPEEETLCLARNLRYFGGNPGYFTQGETGVVVQLWHSKIGMTYTCIDSNDVLATFEMEITPSDVEHCMGPTLV